MHPYDDLWVTQNNFTVCHVSLLEKLRSQFLGEDDVEDGGAIFKLDDNLFRRRIWTSTPSSRTWTCGTAWKCGT